jgi:hypothetical protein
MNLKIHFLLAADFRTATQMPAPSLAFGLGTASQEFSAENSCSGVRLPYLYSKYRTGHNIMACSVF